MIYCFTAFLQTRLLEFSHHIHVGQHVLNLVFMAEYNYERFDLRHRARR